MGFDIIWIEIYSRFCERFFTNVAACQLPVKYILIKFSYTNCIWTKQANNGCNEQRVWQTSYL